MRRAAFTLIEVIAVVTLLGLLAGSTAWYLADDVLAGSRTRLVERIAREDRLARLAGLRLGKPCTLRFDLDRREVHRFAGPQTDEAAGGTLAFRYAGPCAIDRVLVFGAPAAGDGTSAGGEGRATGTVDIVYSSRGRSAGYAVHVMTGEERSGEAGAPGGEVAGWLVFSGLTGQATWMEDEASVEKLGAALAGAEGPDSH